MEYIYTNSEFELTKVELMKFVFFYRTDTISSLILVIEANLYRSIMLFLYIIMNTKLLRSENLLFFRKHHRSRLLTEYICGIKNVSRIELELLVVRKIL